MGSLGALLSGPFHLTGSAPPSFSVVFRSLTYYYYFSGASHQYRGLALALALAIQNRFEK